MLLLDRAGHPVVWTPMGGEVTRQQVGDSYNRRFFLESSLLMRVPVIDPDINRYSTLNLNFTRPYHKEESIFWQLNDEVHEWITDQGWPRYTIDYRWLDDEVSWAVGFPNDTMAAMYNLRWV